MRLTELQVFGSPVEITVDPNISPVVDAGAAFTMDEGATADLTGTATGTDSASLSFLWTQEGGPAVGDFTGTDTLTPSFTAPQVNADTPLTFRLSVSDGIVTVSDTVVVTVRDLGGDSGITSSGSGPIGNNKIGALPPLSLLIVGMLGLLRTRRRR